MTQLAISVENLSKAYRMGAKEEVPDTLTGAVSGMLRAPWRNLRRLNQLSNLREGDTGDDVLWALKDVSFDVNEGEVIGLVGRNGAGKSTLLKVLSRITEPTSGRAVIRGRVSSLLEVGTGFHPELTGRENIYMNGTILGMTKREIDRKFDEIVDFSGVEKFLDTPTKRYSSGMQVRLAFAVAAHLEPEILIIDEVLAVGDAEFQKKCLGKMHDVAASGRTVLFVSHNMGAVRALCSQACVVENGKVSELYPTEHAISRHLRAGMPSQMAQLTEQITRPGKPIAGVMLSRHSSTVRTGCGDPLRFDVTLRRCGVGRFDCGIVIKSMLGERVAVFHTDYHSGRSVEDAEEQTLSCCIPSLPLVPGQYCVDVIIGTGGHTIDVAESCVFLEVDFSDYLGTGRLPKAGQGFVVLTCEWKSVADGSQLAAAGK